MTENMAVGFAQRIRQATVPAALGNGRQTGNRQEYPEDKGMEVALLRMECAIKGSAAKRKIIKG